MLERHLSPTVSLYIRHRIGAADETDGEYGAAHFCEHMMFKGTTTIGTRNYSLEKIIWMRSKKQATPWIKKNEKAKRPIQKLFKDLSEKLRNNRSKQKIYYSQRN